MRLRLYPRKQFDIGWRDLVSATLHCVFAGNREAEEAALEHILPSPDPFVSAFSVSAGFDLCLQALDFPQGSEILMTALTTEDMADIPKHHGLIPVPVDIDPETLAPEPSALEALITERTRAVVIAHLFGTRVPMEPIIAIARKRRLFLFEDCAQAFTGPDYTGHSEADAAMFSFGSVKTITALGGALIRLKDAEMARKMKALKQNYPVQSRREYFSTVLKHIILKLYTIPLIFGLLYRTCVLLGIDFDRVIKGVARDNRVDLLKEIRKQSSFPLLALLARRLRTFDAAQLAERTRVGDEFAESLPRDLSYAGRRAAFHSYWAFPIYAEARERLAAGLREHGFDSTTALSVMHPPPGREGHEPTKIRDASRKLLYLPVYPAVPQRQRIRMSRTIREVMAERSHLHLRDPRRVPAGHHDSLRQSE